jgi:hypothetical protein
MGDEVAKQAAILRNLAEQVAEPAVAGRDGGKALKAKHRNDWRRITDVLCAYPSTSKACWEYLKIVHVADDAQAAKHMAGVWKALASQSGIGWTRPVPVIGWMFAIPGFWSIFLPLLIKLAIAWIESNRNQEQTGDR